MMDKIPESNDLMAWIVFGTVNIGAFSLVTWLVRHTFKFTIPRLAAQFSEQLKETRDAFTEELGAQRESFMQELNEQRKEFRAELHAERTIIGDKIDKLRDSVEDVLKGKVPR